MFGAPNIETRSAWRQGGEAAAVTAGAPWLKRGGGAPPCTAARGR
jgi:hypothetical protein